MCVKMYTPSLIVQFLFFDNPDYAYGQDLGKEWSCTKWLFELFLWVLNVQTVEKAALTGFKSENTAFIENVWMDVFLHEVEEK